MTTTGACDGRYSRAAIDGETGARRTGAVSRDVSSSTSSQGGFAAAGAYLIWGLAPLFWKPLEDINAVELIAHRIVWSLLLLTIVLAVQGRLREVPRALATPRALGLGFLRATLLTGNWLLYVWGVNTGHVVEASLGYFLVPLVNVASGYFMLGERLRRAQCIAIGAATIGVVWLMIRAGRPPWIALGLAVTWGGYGLLRKQSPLGAISGLAAEVTLVAPFALAMLLWRAHTGAGALGHVGAGRNVMLLSTGLITAVPLSLFGYGARRIRLSTLGVLQYMTPSVQLALGVLVYHEQLPWGRLAGFCFIWAGLVLYTFDSVQVQRKLPPPEEG